MLVIYYVVHKSLSDHIMHLSYKTSKYKGKVYKFYFIAESYREGKKVKKRVIWPIGKLTDVQRDRISLICKAFSDPDQVITVMNNIVVQESKPYLDLAVANALWDMWKFSKAFNNHITNSELSTPLIAKILTINKCVSPCSHYSIPQWAKKTALSEVVGCSLKDLNDDKIYYELDKIEHSRKSLENHLFQITCRKDNSSYDFVNYNFFSSYFAGMKCKLSSYEKSKDSKPHNKQVLLGILVNNKGYPFKWDVYPGDTAADVKTLVGNVDACKERFRLKNITLVFDRGIVSDDNLEYIAENGLKYISVLDKDQIPDIEGIDLSVFTGISFDNFKERLSKQEFTCYDESFYFKDLGLTGKQRYILGFNPVLFRDERKCRNENIADNEILDGICVFISNHIESSDTHFLFSGEKIIKAYRDKAKIEDAFKHIKSFLKIRSFYVNLDEHVRAVYSICVPAYFLNKDLAERRKKIDGVDYLNSKNLYEPFRSCHYVTLKDKPSGGKKSKTVELTLEQESLLRQLQIKTK